MKIFISGPPELVKNLAPGQKIGVSIDDRGNAVIIPPPVSSKPQKTMSFLKNLIDFGFGKAIPQHLGTGRRIEDPLFMAKVSRGRKLFKRQKAARKIERAHRK